MRKLTKLIFAASAALLCLSAFAKTDGFDKFEGFYKGRITFADGKQITGWYPVDMYPEIYAEIFRDVGAKYRLKLLTGILSRAETTAVADNLVEKDGKIEFSVNADALSLRGEITPRGVRAAGKHRGRDIKMDLPRYEYVSPRMGQKPPKGAVVLFDENTNPADKWEMAADKSRPFNWVVKDGVMTIKTDAKRPDGKRFPSNIVTKQAFGKCRLHLEFKLPAMYEKNNQQKSNSGVFFGPYEIQILDSFGTEGAWDNCGAIYRQTPPHTNASLPAGSWQTYDIIYTPPAITDGKCVEPAKFTVILNGVVVQRDTPAYYGTAIPKLNVHKFKPSNAPVRITLQDHRDPVQFRNIWVADLEPKKVVRPWTIDSLADRFNADEANFWRYGADNKKLAQKPLAVFMGDSITDNWAKLRPDFFKANNYLGRGISGQVTSQMLVRFRKDVLELKPKVAVILAGTNDVARNRGYISEENVAGNIISMCEIAKANGVKPVICSVLPAAKYRWRPAIKSVESIKKINAMLRDYASKNGIAYADYYSLLDDGNGGLTPADSGDGVHPTSACYKKMEAFISPIIQKLL